MTASTSRAVTPWSERSFPATSAAQTRGPGRELGRLADVEHVAMTVEAHIRDEEVGELRMGRPAKLGEALGRVVPIAQCRAAGRTERKRPGHAAPGVRIARDDERATGRARREQAVDELQPGQDPAAAVGDVEGERARPTDGRVAGVGVDVLLDERGERGLAEVAVAVQTGVDEEVDVARRDVGVREACTRRGVREPPGAVTAPEPAAHDCDGVNACAHSDPRSRRQ